MRFWPDVRSSVDHLVSLAGVNNGWSQTEAYCANGCINAYWQMRPDSRFVAALNAAGESPGEVSFTSVYSRTDPFV